MQIDCLNFNYQDNKKVEETLNIIEKEIEKLEFKGGGGTNFTVAVNAFSKRVENKIIFTDGCADMPDKNIDAIWVVYGNKKIKPKGGRVIYISEEQLNDLKIAKKVFKA